MDEVQLISLVGSLMILAAFTLNQTGRIPSRGVPYLILNVIGSAVLSVIAIEEEQWGFLLLEGVWTLVSLWSLLRVLRRPIDDDTAPTPAR